MSQAPFDSPKFLKAYADAIDAAGKGENPIGGTIRAMIIAYLGSDQFRALSATYRHVIRRECDEITAQAQNAMATHLRDEHIRADLSALDAHKSRARQKAWCQLCGWAVAAGYLSTDPSAGIKRKAIPKTDGHLPWTDDDIDLYRARWPIGSVPRAAMELMLWTGARISDAVLIGAGISKSAHGLRKTRAVMLAEAGATSHQIAA